MNKRLIFKNNPTPEDVLEARRLKAVIITRVKEIPSKDILKANFGWDSNLEPLLFFIKVPLSVSDSYFEKEITRRFEKYLNENPIFTIKPEPLEDETGFPHSLNIQ